jgi:predicted transcriptional regulator of viral defense system
VNRNLSKNEAELILDLEWRNQRLVTLAELRNTLGASESYARYLAHSLVKKGWLERLRPGVYQLVPAERGPEGVGDTNPLAAGAALVSPYFFSFGTACTHHGLTEQLFSEVYLACQQRRPPKILRGMRYVLIYVRENRFFGFNEVAVLGVPVQMATTERALLDAIDRPKYAGGIGEVSHIASRAIDRISWDVLLEIAERWRSSALVQRLGYLLDLHQADMPTEARGTLLRLVLPRSKIQFGPRRRWGTSGRLVQPWNVIENVPREVLMATGEAPKRRILFPRRNGDR